VPINLHVENFRVKSDKDDQTSKYEFTSCGAFTTYHYRSAISDEKFDPDNQIFINNNFLLLIFYTLKTFISLTDDLRCCLQLNNHLFELENKKLV
jgi:hypothetical protein